MRSEARAPIGRVFTSLEGESSRVGELTSFVHVADGVYCTAKGALLKVLPEEERHALVLDTCEATYFGWESFADAFVHEAREQGWKNINNETRGERVFDWMNVPMYLHLTPGLTVLRPKQLNPKFDEVKLLVHSEDEVGGAIDRLSAFAKRGIQSFLLPRVGRDTLLAKGCMARFLTLPNPHGVRMMLIEHEVTGID